MKNYCLFCMPYVSSSSNISIPKNYESYMGMTSTRADLKFAFKKLMDAKIISGPIEIIGFSRDKHSSNCSFIFTAGDGLSRTIRINPAENVLVGEKGFDFKIAIAATEWPSVIKNEKARLLGNQSKSSWFGCLSFRR